jgi:hypothetical protein
MKVKPKSTWMELKKYWDGRGSSLGPMGACTHWNPLAVGGVTMRLRERREKREKRKRRKEEEEEVAHLTRELTSHVNLSSVTSHAN